MTNDTVPKPRRVLYVVSRFPQVSLTFTTHEMAGVAAEGVEVFVAPVWRTLPDQQPHDMDKPFLEKTVRVNLRSARTWATILGTLLRHPGILWLVLTLLPGHLKSIYLPFKLLAAVPKGICLGQWCAENGIDHIHAHFMTSPTTVALIASAISGVPYSYTAHAFDITSRHPRSVNGSIPRKARRAGLGITISQYNRRYMQERWLEIRRARLQVVYNGIDTDKFAPPDEPPLQERPADQPWRIVSVSRLEEKKGFDVLIRAVAELRARGLNVCLDIYGDGEQRCVLQGLIDALGQGEHITLHGVISQEALAEKVREADLFALASVPLAWGDVDGLPTVLIEALAAQLPTVSTQVTGIPEIILDHETGLCVPPRDVKALADALQWLIEHPAEAREMGRRGRQLVLERFDRRKNAGQLLAAWRDLHAGREAAPDTAAPRKMLILYLHQHFTTREGSWGTRSYEFSRLLHEMGHEVTIICGASDRSGLSHRDGQLLEEHDLGNMRVLSLNVPYGQHMGYLRRMASFVWFMLLASWVALRQRDTDVIFATSTPLTIGVPALIAALFRRRPFVFEVRDLWPDVPIGLGVLRNRVFVALARSLEWLIYHRARHIVALSPGMKAGVVRRGIPPDRVTVIPNSSDNDLFDVSPEVGQAFRAQHPELGDRPLVVYTGSFGLANDVSYLVRLAERVGQVDERVSFLLVGNGSELDKIRALAREKGVLDRNLWIMGTVTKAEMPAILSAATMAASVFCDNPVLWHNSANKFFDALASGTPVLINYQGWQAELLRESGAGLVLSATDIDHAARRLVEALHAPAWLAEAGAAARRLAREQFARDKLARQLEAVLQVAART